jgi:aryl-alcohol dehydrogenase-like predicted oxidoreductase
MTFGEDWGWGSSKDDARKIYDAYREAGGNFIDTANLYTNGASERFVGEFASGHRDEVVIATKYTNAAPGTDANVGGNQRKAMMRHVDDSLQRLGTDYIDLYWLHAWDQITPTDEVMRAFDDLVRSGKILYIGVSNAPAWVIAQSNLLAELRGWTQYVGMQIEYSLLERTVERELVPLAKDQGMSVVAWSPLKNGQLTGKYLPESANAEGGRLDNEMIKEFARNTESTDLIVREVVAVAKEIGASPAQVALAWLRYRPVPVIPIIGARKFSQFEDNLASLDVKLDASQVERLDAVSAIPLGYPHDLYRMDLMSNFVYGGLKNRILV